MPLQQSSMVGLRSSDSDAQKDCATHCWGRLWVRGEGFQVPISFLLKTNGQAKQRVPRDAGILTDLHRGRASQRWAESDTEMDPYPGQLQEPKGWWSNNDNVMWNRTSWRWSYGQHTRCWRKPYLQWRGAHSKSNRPFKPTMNLILMHLVIIDSLAWLLPQGNKLLYPETTAWRREKEPL